MQIEPGTSLAHYEIIAPLGKGGMGEVYRATDTRLGREVAIKVLPDEFTKDVERLARFEREARVLASLSHSNIASIFEIGSTSRRDARKSFAGTQDMPADEPSALHYLVMELAPGEDLSDRLRRGPIPVDEAVELAKQIAEGLEAAHEQGIVHRDLKPANIKIDEEGNVKILDFGLAKALEAEEVDQDFSDSPTMIRAATHAGVILGTAAYMSPEQARGKKVDKRADIWAFGVVLWEMLTGKRLFEGETVSDTLASVLTKTPDLSDLPDGTPRMIGWVLQRCLERSPKSRLHDIADARIILDAALGAEEVESPEARAGSLPPFSRQVHLIWMVGLIAACALTAWLSRSSSSPEPASDDPVHLAIHLAPNQQLTTRGNSTLAFSPDGRNLVFPGTQDGQVNLFRRDLTKRETTPIPGTSEGEAPFFSPDGNWIGFIASGKLQKVSVDGGRPFQLAEARGAGGATWLAGDTIVFAPIYSDGLFRVSANGGTPEQLTTPDREGGELGHWWPDPLPDMKHVIFTAFRTPVDDSRVGVVNLETHQVEWIVEGGFYGRYVESGHILYGRGQRLFALPFDAETRVATGPAVAVLDDVGASQTGGYSMAAVSSRGTLAYVTESLGSPLSELVWLDLTGRATPAMKDRHRILSVSLSPDGLQAALTIKGESRDLWIYSFAKQTLSRLTSGDDTEFDPVWSADGRELFYVVDTPPFQLHRITVGSPDSGRPIWDEPAELDTTAIGVSPDGRTVAFTVSEPDTGSNIYVRPIDGSEPPRPVRATRAQEDWPAFSPDGGWIAYQSDETGQLEIYVDPYPGPGERVQITSDGGADPTWSKNGEIFFRRADEIWTVATRTGDRFEFEPPKLLHTYPFVPRLNDTRTSDVSADGSRILAMSIPDANRPRQIEIVIGWASELLRLAPPKK